MKPREVLYLFGYKPRARVYGYDIREADLGPDGVVRYAQWQHPKAYRCAPSIGAVAEHRRYIRPGDFCIDIGANSGDSTLPIALAAGSEGCVLALEPNRYVFPTLEENARLNPDRTNIVPLMAAATGAAGKFTFSYGDPGFCNGGDGSPLGWLARRRMFELEVDGVDLNEVLHRDHADRLPNLRFIKTDTEGHDLSVLRSVAGLIETYQPFIQAEVFQGSSAADRVALFDFLADLGYDVRIVTNSHLAGTPVNASEICRVGHCDLFALPSRAAQQAA
ncbi:MAG: FkbM family methyltransferase [Planctomycetota bacterium]